MLVTLGIVALCLGLFIAGMVTGAGIIIVLAVVGN